MDPKEYLSSDPITKTEQFLKVLKNCDCGIPKECS
jgi:hypothetical protein